MAEKRRLGPALSSRAHAFSVEALIGVSGRKRRRDGGINEEGDEDDEEEEEEEEEDEDDEEEEAEGDHERGKSGGGGGSTAERAAGAEQRQRGAGNADPKSTPVSDPVVTAGDRDEPPADPARGPSTPAAAAAATPGPAAGLGTPQGGPPSDLAGVRVELQGSELWQRFHSIGTEMIITKAGRRMFPAIRVKVSGLLPQQHYHLAMDIVPLDNKRYRYVYHSSKWIVAGNADAAPPHRLYLHPDSPASGDTWARGVVSFDRAKLTNNELDESGHIILHSMHRYLPRVHVVRKEPGQGAHVAPSPGADNSRTFSFPETVFTTVTAYQNQQITRLKIDRNPFAKGFRESGRNRTGLEALMDSYTLWRPPGRALSLEEAAAGGRLHASQASLLDASLMASGFGAAPPPGHHHHHHHMFLPTMGPVHMAGSPHPHAHHHHHHHAAAAAAAAAQHHHHHQQQQQQQQQQQAMLAHHHHHHHAHQHVGPHGDQQPRFSGLASCCGGGGGGGGAAGAGGGGSVGGQTVTASGGGGGGCTDSFASALALHGPRAGLQHLGLPRLGLACSISRKEAAQADEGPPMASFQPALPCLMAQHAAHGAALKDFCSFFP